MPEAQLCKNCNSKLKGQYCSNCGQKDGELLSVKAIVREFTDNVFSFDSRFFITLKYLVTKPGFLTTEYWAGKCTKYLSPLRLYLVLSVLYFFISPIIEPDSFLQISSNDDGEKVPFQIKLDNPQPIIINYLVENINKGHRIAFERQLSYDNLLYSILPSAMFILMPLMGLLILLLYKKHILFYSFHLISALHFHCFVFVIYLINVLLPFFDFLFLVILFYTVLMMKRIYSESWIKTLMKSPILLITYGTTVTLISLALLHFKLLLLGYNA